MIREECSRSDVGHFVVRAFRGSGVCDCGTGEPERLMPCGGDGCDGEYAPDGVLEGNR